MTATISRRRVPATAPVVTPDTTDVEDTDNTEDTNTETPVTVEITPANRNGNGNGRTNPGPANSDAPTQGNLGELRFNVTKGSVPQPARGGGERVEIPVTIKNAFFDMADNNPMSDETSMAHVGPVDLTNKQIIQWIKGGVAKWSKEFGGPDYIKSSVVTHPDSENKQSADKDNADKKVRVVWIVRQRTDAERDAIVRRRDEKNAVTA
jgi:hypothetical protein